MSAFFTIETARLGALDIITVKSPALVAGVMSACTNLRVLRQVYPWSSCCMAYTAAIGCGPEKVRPTQPCKN